MKIKTVLFAVICLVTFQSNVSAAYEAYLRMDTIAGDSPREVWAGHTAVIGYNHEVNAVRDANGSTTGRRQHAPFKFLKEISGNSPLFMQKLVDNSTIETADLTLVRTNPNGQEVSYYKYRFTGVKILSVRNWMPNVVNNPTHSVHELEEVTFSYSTIEWTVVATRTSASDTVK